MRKQMTVPVATPVLMDPLKKESVEHLKLKFALKATKPVVPVEQCTPTPPVVATQKPEHLRPKFALRIPMPIMAPKPTTMPAMTVQQSKPVGHCTPRLALCMPATLVEKCEPVSPTAIELTKL